MQAEALSTAEIYKMTPESLVVHLVRKQWRQEQIAFEADTSQATISRIMSGKHHGTRYAVIERLRELVLKLETEL